MNLPSLVHQSRHHSRYSHSIQGNGLDYSGHHHQSPAPYQHRSHEYAHPPAPPPSPPVEDNNKCSLPSISTLLVYADGGQPGGNGMDRMERQQHSPQYQSEPLHTPRPTLPPTPPMRPDSVFEGNNSPTLPSTSPSSSCFYSPTSSQGGNRNSYPPAQSKYPPPPEPPYHPQYSSYPPSAPQSQPAMAYTSNPWHHHHHSSPASHAAFPQSQDRYICQTCNKAFSRPSSLRIHSHSHTGEKPFKCPHHGCGKAFSVRSNMKRHERGCHQ
ncbi:hypothetical protein L873DRAFT_1827122 [Choiromyces venosus 120613-1]|uniref:C2H2-type domain-containing protein n=1 Tax=Choiromyces venosus 120613-1 TaxID=1336337 RepID=A0A3N4JUI7_9PEZI|nr:hypothetical protein L873DRAFT_1827122 [Choiromyces venosus 120613-1]